MIGSTTKLEHTARSGCVFTNLHSVSHHDECLLPCKLLDVVARVIGSRAEPSHNARSQCDYPVQRSP